MFTRYAEMCPSCTSSVISCTHAPVTLSSVLQARSTPFWIASSKLLSLWAVISVTRAMA